MRKLRTLPYRMMAASSLASNATHLHPWFALLCATRISDRFHIFEWITIVANSSSLSMLRSSMHTGITWSRVISPRRLINLVFTCHITEATLSSRFCNWQYIQVAVMLYRLARSGKFEFKVLSVSKWLVTSCRSLVVLFGWGLWNIRQPDLWKQHASEYLGL